MSPRQKLTVTLVLLGGVALGFNVYALRWMAYELGVVLAAFLGVAVPVVPLVGAPFLLGTGRPWSRLRRRVWMAWVISSIAALVLACACFAIVFAGP